MEDSEDDALLLARELKRGGYEPVHERVCTRQQMEKALAPRWLCMVGRATGRAVSSMRAMLDPRMIAAKIHGAAFGAQGVCVPFDRITPSSQGCLITLGGCRLPQDYSNASPFPIRGLLPADNPCPGRGNPALT